MLSLSTNNGLAKFNVTKGIFNNYDQKDGLPSNEFNRASCLKLQDGRLLFGNYKGLVSFNPSDIKENLYAPAVLITDLKLFNKSVIINMMIIIYLRKVYPLLKSWFLITMKIASP